MLTENNQNITTGWAGDDTEFGAGASATFTKLTAPTRTEGHPYKLHVLNDGSLVVSYSRRVVNGEYAASSGVYYSTDGGTIFEDRSHADMQYWTKDIVVDPHDANQNTWFVGIQDFIIINFLDLSI